jgi:hypothetical protein
LLATASALNVRLSASLAVHAKLIAERVIAARGAALKSSPVQTRYARLAAASGLPLSALPSSAIDALPASHELKKQIHDSKRQDRIKQQNNPAAESKNQILKTNQSRRKMTKYISTADTAKIIRKALKESFPDMKFSVKSKSLVVGISWTDGANVEQVKSVIGHLKAAYFDGSIDYKGSIYHMHQGQQVHLGADYLNFKREYTDAAIQRAIERVYRDYAGNFADTSDDKATVEQYKQGKLANVGIRECMTVTASTACKRLSAPYCRKTATVCAFSDRRPLRPFL